MPWDDDAKAAVLRVRTADRYAIVRRWACVCAPHLSASASHMCRHFVVSAAERRLKAYHEAGHVIVARASPAARPVEKVTIVPHGGTAGGLTVLSLDDESLPSRDAILAQLDVAMGGRAAERLAVGSSAVTTGASLLLRRSMASSICAAIARPASDG
mgnify:CR=1 FL=1